LEINDKDIFFLYSGKLIEIPVKDIRKIHVHGYSLRAWKLWPTLIFSVITNAIAFSVVSENADKEVFAAVIFIPPLLLLPYAYFTGDPQISFSVPLDKEEIKKLKPYCRYPQGLDQLQRKKLLILFKQEKFLKLTEVFNE